MHFVTTTWFIALVGVVFVGLALGWGRAQKQRVMVREHSADVAGPTTTGKKQAGQEHSQHKHNGGCC